MLTDEGFFRAETDAINAANAEYKTCATNPELAELKAQIQADRAAYQQEEQTQRQVMIDGRRTQATAPTGRANTQCR